jgi:hypothetical protein
MTTMLKTTSSVLLLMPLFALSQSINGTVKKSKNTISYAEIIARKDKYKQSTISDEKGHFDLKLVENGIYTIECIYDGNTLYKAEVKVNGNTAYDLLIPDVNEKQIEGITVTARKKLIERKADRLILICLIHSITRYGRCTGIRYNTTDQSR